MRRDEAIQRLAAARGELASFAVKALFLFGSVARDEATEGSDIDILVDFEETPSLSSSPGFSDLSASSWDGEWTS